MPKQKCTWILCPGYWGREGHQPQLHWRCRLVGLRQTLWLWIRAVRYAHHPDACSCQFHRID
jgi:hypothetical protein